MIKRAIVILAAFLVTPAVAENRIPDNPLVSATIAALQTRNLAELEWLVAKSDALQFPLVASSDRAEAVKMLAGCKPRELQRVGLGPFDYYEFEWRCPKQTYVGKLIPLPGAPAVGLADLVTRTVYDKLIQKMPRVLLPPVPVMSITPPPPPSAAELAERDRRRASEMAGKKERAEQFAQAVTKGDLTDFKTRHATNRQITYGFFDPFSQVDYTDKSWRIGDTQEDAGKALLAAVAHSRSQLGQPINWACQDAYPYIECIWRFPDPGTLLKAKIHVVRQSKADWGLIVFGFRYETAAKMRQAKRRAAR